MRPPTEEEINEEVDDGYGLQYEGEPSFVIQIALDFLKAELDGLEMTAEMVADRWASQLGFLITVVRHYILSLELETEWVDEVDEAGVAHYQQKLLEARDNLQKETEEYIEGKKKSDEAIQYKKLQIAVVDDILRRSYIRPLLVTNLDPSAGSSPSSTLSPPLLMPPKNTT